MLPNRRSVPFKGESNNDIKKELKKNKKMKQTFHASSKISSEDTEDIHCIRSLLYVCTVRRT